jgi:hypothetical protein
MLAHAGPLPEEQDPKSEPGITDVKNEQQLLDRCGEASSV